LISLHATSLDAQGRFRVLVPDLLPRAGADDDFGRDVAAALRNRIDDMDTHVSVPRDEVRDALRSHRLDADRLDCVAWRQLAVRMDVEIVFCGSYTEAGGVRTVAAEFQGARSGEPFTVPGFDAADDDEAADRIQGAFQAYVEQLRTASICVEYASSEQWDRARETCDAALAANPEMVSPRYARGRAYLGLAEAAGAEGDPESREAEGDPEPREALLRQALADFDGVLERSPGHEAALQGAGYASTLLDERELALDYYRRLLEFDPGNVQVRIRLSLELANHGDPAGALALVEEGLPSAPGSLALKRYAGHFATSAGQRLRATEARPGAPGRDTLDAVEEAVARDSPRVYFDRAVGYFDAVLEAAPDSLDAVTLRSMLPAYAATGRSEDVLAVARPAVERLPPDAPLLLALAAVERQLDLDAAVATTDRARAIDPTAARYDMMVGAWLLEAGRIADAEQRFRRGVDAGEGSGDAVADQLFAHAIRGPYRAERWEEAAALLESAASWAEAESLRARARFFAGYALLQRGIQIEDGETAEAARRALPVFQRALELLQAGRGAREAGEVDRLLDATRRYIEIQELVIRRGR
jgi:tetratricopeptide (TPR) repeat protein